jgi:hypothetical protein
MPPVVTGYVLLLLFGRKGPLGEFLADRFGIVFAFRWTGAALACAIMGLPLMVRAIRLSIEAVDRRLEDAAATLGAAPVWVFLVITLPLTLPGIIAGMILSFARSMGEFGATITFVSNIPGETQTLPSLIYTLTQIPGGDAGPPPNLDLDRDLDAGVAGCRISRAAARPHSSGNVILAGDRAAARRHRRFRCDRFLNPLAGCLELAQPRGGCRVRLGLDRAILVDQSCSEGRQGGAAAMASARLSRDDRLAEAVVHVVDEEPCPAVRHAERKAGFGDRSGVADRLQQANFSRTDRPILPQIDAQG